MIFIEARSYYQAPQPHFPLSYFGPFENYVGDFIEICCGLQD